MMGCRSEARQEDPATRERCARRQNPAHIDPTQPALRALRDKNFMAETNAAKFKPLILAPTQSAIPLSSYLLIADPSELPFAQRAEYAVRGERQPLGFFGRVSERLAEVASGKPNVESSWAKAMAIADKKLTAIGFEPANDTEKMPIELGSVGSLSRARLFIGWFGFFRAMSVDLEALAKKTANAEVVSRAIRGFGAPVSMGGLAYAPPLFGTGSDRVHIHVNGPHRTDDALRLAGDILAKRGFEMEQQAGANLPVGQAFALLHESFHLVQERDALRHGVRAIVPKLDYSKSDYSNIEGGQTRHRVMMIHLESVIDRSIKETRRAVFSMYQGIKLDGREEKAFAAEQKEKGFKQKEIKKMWAERSVEKAPKERRKDRSLYFSKLMKECYADIMASVALAEGDPTRVAEAAHAVKEWRGADLNKIARSRKSNVSFFAKMMMKKSALKGDEHQTQEALSILAELTENVPVGVKPSMSQWAEAARACALAGVLRWSLDASQRPAPSEELMQTKGRRATLEEQSMLDGELARNTLFAINKTGIGDDMLDNFEAQVDLHYPKEAREIARSLRKDEESSGLAESRPVFENLEALAIATAKSLLSDTSTLELSALSGFAARREAVKTAGEGLAQTTNKADTAREKKNKKARKSNLS